MKVLIKNMATYSRQVQYFRKNQYVVLEPRDTLVVPDVHDQIEVAYWESLIRSGFSVCFKHDDVPDVEPPCIDKDDIPGIVDHKDCDLEEDKKCPCDLSGFSDDQLKRICKNLGVQSRVRARWKLESLIIDNLPRDASVMDYLDD